MPDSDQPSSDDVQGWVQLISDLIGGWVDRGLSQQAAVAEAEAEAERIAADSQSTQLMETIALALAQLQQQREQGGLLSGLSDLEKLAGGLVLARAAGWI